jgi:hypothetical protein
MRNAIGSLVLGAAVLTGACAKNTKPTVEAKTSCPMPARSSDFELRGPEMFKGAPGPFDVPDMVDKEYLLAPTNSAEFEETMASCVAAYKAADVEGGILSKSPVKTCRTVQHVYDLQKRVVDSCKPIAYAEGFMYAKIDPEIREQIFLIKAELKKWVAQIGTIQKAFPECFGHGEEKPKKLPAPPQHHFEQSEPKMLQVKAD